MFANKTTFRSGGAGKNVPAGHFIPRFLLFLFLSPGVFGFSELFFIKEPHDVTVMRRDPVILDCQAHGESPIDVRWLKNGVSVAESERVNLLSNGSLYISEVESRRADKSDEGLYQCLAQNKYGAILSQKARLTIASKCVTLPSVLNSAFKCNFFPTGLYVGLRSLLSSVAFRLASLRSREGGKKSAQAQGRFEGEASYWCVNEEAPDLKVRSCPGYRFTNAKSR